MSRSSMRSTAIVFSSSVRNLAVAGESGSRKNTTGVHSRVGAPSARGQHVDSEREMFTAYQSQKAISMVPRIHRSARYRRQARWQSRPQEELFQGVKPFGYLAPFFGRTWRGKMEILWRASPRTFLRRLGKRRVLPCWSRLRSIVLLCPSRRREWRRKCVLGRSSRTRSSIRRAHTRYRGSLEPMSTG